MNKSDDSMAEMYETLGKFGMPLNLMKTLRGDRFQQKDHLRAINGALMALTVREHDRLMIQLPPQMGATTLCSIAFISWYLTLFPECRVILATYQEGLSVCLGRKIAETVNNLDIEHMDEADVNEWGMWGHDGGLHCKGLSGSITGRPCDLLVVDSAIKADFEASSEEALAEKWNWYAAVVHSRLRQKAGIVVVGPRWSKNDLFGRITREAAKTGEVWNTLKFTAIATENDPLGRKPGEALWPERMPLERLLTIQKDCPHWFKACWQQEPEDADDAPDEPIVVSK